MSYDKYRDRDDDYDCPVNSTVESVAKEVADELAWVIKDYYDGSIEELIGEYEESGEDLAVEMAKSADRVICSGNIGNIEVDFKNRSVYEVYYTYWTFMGSRCYESDIPESWDFEDFEEEVLELTKKMLTK